MNAPRSRILMTVDSVGGIWRYAMTLAKGLCQTGTETVFLVLGPAPDQDQQEEARSVGHLISGDAPLDWMAASRSDLRQVGRLISAVADAENVDLLHLNLPSQAADLATSKPVLVCSHSCVATWFRAVRRTPLPPEWAWQYDLNAEGLDRADHLIAPSISHASALKQCYHYDAPVGVAYNACPASVTAGKKSFVYAAARWWDDGKNAGVLDSVAAAAGLPVLAAGPVSGPDGTYRPFRHAVSLGDVSHRAVQSLAAQARYFISPSIYEPFGLATLEAAAGGAALILSDIPTYRELWEDAALFADPGKPEEFAAHIERLQTNPHLREEMTMRSRGRARSFVPETQAAAMQSIYDGLLQGTVLTNRERI